MKISIIDIKNGGIPSEERVIIRVTEDTNIGRYLVMVTKELEPGTISGRPERVYWFPDKDIKNGDLIILYSKQGKDSEVISKNGSTSHFFYMGSHETFWNNPKDSVAVLEVNEWDYKALP